ncbi:VirB3 family type IV secretion system protein, partial [Lachnospiraceae bacterium OttesenSCG-928-E19]|nr:VirB3 family type IV secretion system protein [Lachnospiraceae bacterium OttesenSCG-928-E19]
ILLTCNKGKDVRQQVLKALANPSRIFYVPYSLAVMNFAVQFLIFIGLFIVDLTINGTSAKLNPLYFLISVILVHSLLAVFSKREPQLGQIISARIRLYKSRIPGRLIA